MDTGSNADRLIEPHTPAFPPEKVKDHSLGPCYCPSSGLASWTASRTALAWRQVRPHSQGRKTGRLTGNEPTKFDFVINLQTPRTLGIGVPPLLLAQAEEVIE